MSSENLPDRLRSYIRDRPGTFEDRIIADVTGPRDKTSDTERVLEVLKRTGQAYTCEIWDDRMQRFSSLCYLMDQVPIVPENPALIPYHEGMTDPEDCRCLRPSPPNP